MDWLEVRFWKVARWILLRGYGEPCSDFSADCVQCRAGRAVAFISDHIDLLNWSRKNR